MRVGGDKKAMVLTLPSGGRPRANELIERNWRVRYWHKADIKKCPLMTQSGHRTS